MKISEFENSVVDIITQAAKHISLSPGLEVKVVEVKNSDALTELHGVGAYCPAGDFVQITFDTEHPDYPEKSFQTARVALFHELHHAAKRYEGIEIDRGRLFDVVLYEGMADRFAYEVTGKMTTWIEKTINTNLADNYLNLFEAEKETEVTPAVYKKWFLGETEEVPRWTGYAIGWKLAGEQ